MTENKRWSIGSEGSPKFGRHAVVESVILVPKFMMIRYLVLIYRQWTVIREVYGDDVECIQPVRHPSGHLLL